MEEERVKNSAENLSTGKSMSSKIVALTALEQELGLGAMFHDADDGHFQEDLKLWDPQFFPYDTYDMVEDFYGRTENVDIREQTDESVDWSDFLGLDEYMDWQAANEDEGEELALNPSLTLLMSEVLRDSSENSQPNATPEALEINARNEMGGTSPKESKNLLLSREFEHSHLYSQKTPLVRGQPNLRRGTKDQVEGQDRSHKQEPPQPISPVQCVLEAPPPIVGNDDNIHKEDQQRPQTTDLSPAYSLTHVGFYFYPVVELKVLLCTACHHMCPNRQLYIDQHLTRCHGLPRIRHVITGCLSILPENLPQDQNLNTLARRLKDEFRAGRPDIEIIPFLEASEAYACPAADCYHVDHDSRRILSHCRSVHEISTFRKNLGRVLAQSIYVNKTTKISVTVRKPAPDSPSTVFITAV